MALVWAESFNLYGTSGTFFSQAGYTTTCPLVIGGRTGTWCAQTNGNSNLNRPLTNPASTIGIGVAMFVNSLGGAGFDGTGLRWTSAAGFEMSVVVQADLSLAVYDRTSTRVGFTAPNTLFVSSWSWVEVKAVNNSAGVNTGYVEVRVNGVTKLIINNINLPNQFTFTRLGSSSNGTSNVNWADYIVWDNTGAQNNDFMGDRRLVVCFPNANGVPQDFTPSAGNAWDCVNNSPPVDTTFISGAAAGNVSEFSKTGVGIAANDIAAMVIVGRLFKTDAGVATGRVGVDSNGNIVNSPELFPGTTGSYFQQIQELDPNGNIPWNLADFDAANILVTRVQ